MSHRELSAVIRGSLYRVGLDRRVPISRRFVFWVMPEKLYVWHVDPRTFKLVLERFHQR